MVGLGTGPREGAGLGLPRAPTPLLSFEDPESVLPPARMRKVQGVLWPENTASLGWGKKFPLLLILGLSFPVATSSMFRLQIRRAWSSTNTWTGLGSTGVSLFCV